MDDCSDFQALTPDVIIDAVERATGKKMTGFTSPLPSYINRVYELQAFDETRLIGKFYRPGRWTEEALRDEHRFIADCRLDEIPVISPLTLSDGETLAETNGIHFSVFPKKYGREFEVTRDEDWRRIGRLIARVHVAGASRPAPHRVRLHPLESTASDVERLSSGGLISKRFLPDFREIGSRLMDLSARLFEGVEMIRIHGDCHNGNLLFRPEDGIMIIDFDDMMMGPPVQDIWLLLHDYANRSRKEIHLILEGYEQFREFDDRSLRLIEPLRAMRNIYFLAWCGQQIDDHHFQRHFPDWGNETFWQKEISDLQAQLSIINEHLPDVT